MAPDPTPSHRLAPDGSDNSVLADRSQASRETVARLQKSDIYSAYQNAFNGTTGLPLALRSLGSFHSPLLNARNANPLCRLMASNNKSCAACLCLQQQVEDASDGKNACTLECFAGLSESAVPIRTGEQVVAFLQTGQVLLHRPSASRFRRSLHRLKRLGAVVDRAEMERAYFATRVLAKPQYDSILSLLTLIAEHLSSVVSQSIVQRSAGEPPAIDRARAYIALHQCEEISLGDVAKAVNMSAFYFCKTFRKVTGFTFIDYLARLRIESVKIGLLNPHKRISEAAYEAGFQSLSQFNRVFRRIAGQAPTAYRSVTLGQRSVCPSNS
jgi:AraC-like DNA-binding protein